VGGPASRAVTKGARKDPFDAAAWDHVWTPPHGTDKRMLRRKARARLRRWLIRVILGREEE
jgi:hypothetical protein